MLKKAIIATILSAGIAFAASGGNLYSGLFFTKASYSAGGDSVDSDLMLGADLGFVKKISKTNIILGAEFQGTTGKLKDYGDSISSLTALGLAGYRFNTELPVDVYGLFGYRVEKIGDFSANGTGYGVGAAVNIGTFRPTIEYTHFNIKDKITVHENRVAFFLNFNII